LLGRGRVDASVLQASQPLDAIVLVDDLEGLVARIQALLHEGQKDFILFISAVEEGARVT
jgi:hypothetical protein